MPVMRDPVVAVTLPRGSGAFGLDLVHLCRLRGGLDIYRKGARSPPADSRGERPDRSGCLHSRVPRGPGAVQAHGLDPVILGSSLVLGSRNGQVSDSENGRPGRSGMRGGPDKLFWLVDVFGRSPQVGGARFDSGSGWQNRNSSGAVFDLECRSSTNDRTGRSGTPDWVPARTAPRGRAAACGWWASKQLARPIEHLDDPVTGSSGVDEEVTERETAWQ